MIDLAPSNLQKVNKHPKFDDHFNIRHQLEDFEYDMIRTIVEEDVSDDEDIDPKHYQTPTYQRSVNYNIICIFL